MHKIWKFKLKTGIDNTFMIPRGSTILSGQTDRKNDCPTIWVAVDVDQENLLTERTFKIYPTGQKIVQEIHKIYNYIDTFQTKEGLFVGHIYEIIDGINTQEKYHTKPVTVKDIKNQLDRMEKSINHMKKLFENV